MELMLRRQEVRQDSPRGGEPREAGRPLVDWRASLRRASHACCCPAKPAVVVIMPASAGRPLPVDLLLCGHHYRASEQALAAAGAEVFDTRGAPLSPDRFALAPTT